MGLYLNPGNEEFRNAAIHSKIYVDKTEMIKFTNSQLFGEHKNICVSRPRRFGKSMAANMLVAYYSKGCDSKELFENFKIADDSSFKEHLNKYNVIHLNIQQFLGRTETIHEMLELLSRKVTRELKREFADVTYYEEDLVSVIEEIYAQTHSFFVFIIDEWDCIFRVKGEDTEAQKLYLNFLRDLLKNQPYCILAYMTGILPIKKYGEHSALNMFDEYSMTNQRELAEFTGFTEQEVQELCPQYDMSYDKMKQWYDGYDLKGIQIYNPRSVVMSLSGHDFDSYWTKTETYEALKKYIQMDMYNLKELVTRLIAGSSIEINPDKFQNDMTTFASADDVLTLLVHLGYLTYDSDEAGTKAALRAAPILREAGVTTRVIRMEPYKDPDEFIKNLGAEAFEERIRKARNSFMFGLEMLEKGYDLNAPEGKTEFLREAARRLARFEEEIERDNYIEAVAKTYHVGYEELKKLVVKVAVQSGMAAPATKPRQTIRQETPKEDGHIRSQKILLTWLIDREELFDQVSRYVTPEDFTVELYRKVAELLYEQHAKGELNPAQIMNYFTEEEEHRAVAALFNTRIKELTTAGEQEKAIKETILRVKEYSIETATRNLDPTDIQGLQRLMNAKKAVQDLHKLHISIN